MAIDIHFVCPCGAIVEEAVEGAVANLLAEPIADSTDEEWSVVVCDGCGKDFEVHVVSSIAGTEVRIDGAIDLNWDLPPDEMDEELIWEIESTDQFDIYKKVTSDVISLLKSNYPAQAADTLHCMLYAQVVTAVEAYLSGVFIHTVMNSEELIRALVESDPELAKRKFSLSEIFTKYKDLQVEVARYLKDLIFHDLKKVMPMYRAVLSYDFGDIIWLFQAVLIRHDCVHRNGYTKDGKRRPIDAEVIRELVINCTKLISSVDQHISDTYPKT